MADRLERSEMLRRRAASDIAHDLATPATVLESQLQAMIDGVVPTDVAGLEAARSAAAALGGVVADIDDLARAEAAPLQARPAAVDLATAIPEIALALDGPRRERSRPARRRRRARDGRLGRSRPPRRGRSATWSPTRWPTARPAASSRSARAASADRRPDPRDRPGPGHRRPTTSTTSSSASTGPTRRGPRIRPPGGRPVSGSA